MNEIWTPLHVSLKMFNILLVSVGKQNIDDISNNDYFNSSCKNVQAHKEIFYWKFVCGPKKSMMCYVCYMDTMQCTSQICVSCILSLHGQKKNNEIVNYVSFPNRIRVVLLVQRIIKLNINSNSYGYQDSEMFDSIIFLHLLPIVLHPTGWIILVLLQYHRLFSFSM